MARLTVKWLLNEMTATMSHYWSDLIRRERQLKDYCDQLYYRLDFQANAISEESREIQTLTQLVKEQSEVIATLTEKVEELANELQELGDEEALLHQWNDRQQQRIVALEKRFNEELPESHHRRVELHGAWIAELFNRLNDHVNKE